jgi:2-C-methyl-D-erythritol 4-phosphate cytidylyltransferase
MSSVPFVALVPAAGSGSRLGHAMPKQYLPLGGWPMIRHTVTRLASHPRIGRVAVVLSAQDEWFDGERWDGLQGKLQVLRCGGDSRAATVRNGLEALAGEIDRHAWVLVHDAARPCLGRAVLDRLIDSLEHDPVGGLLALPVADTLKRADADRRIEATVPREHLWAAQTPQMFRLGLLREALAQADPALTTDEASAVEALGLRPRLVEGDPVNLKVTYARDVALAARFLEAGEE